MVYPTITFHGRRFAVIDGIPFYCSSGVNSGHPGIWFPFLMVVGSRQIRIPSSYERTYKMSELSLLFSCNENNYLLKYSASILQKPDIHDLCDGRLPTLNSVKISLALGSNLNEIKAFAQVKNQIDQSQITPIELSSDAPVYEFPDLVNEWLVRQGAVFLSKVLTAETRPSVQSMKIYYEQRMSFSQRKLPSTAEPIVMILKVVRDEVKLISRAPSTSVVRRIQKELSLMGLYIALWDINEAIKARYPHEMSYGECYSMWKTQGSFFEHSVTNYQLLSNQRSPGARVEFFSMDEPNSQQCLATIDRLFLKLDSLADKASELRSQGGADFTGG